MFAPLIAFAIAIASSPVDDTAAFLRGFRNPPPESRMRMFWRVFGPALDPDEAEYQFGLMRAAGIGGVTTFFFYPVALDDPEHGIRNLRLGSPEFLKNLGESTGRAKKLGIRFCVAGGSGWPFGGPTVSIHDSAQKIRREIVRPGVDGAYHLPVLRE